MAVIHTAASVTMVTFVLVPIYMTTTGESVGHDAKTMITGHDTIEMDEAGEA